MSGSNTPRNSGPPRIGRIGQLGSSSTPNNSSSSSSGSGRITTFSDFVSSSSRQPERDSDDEEEEKKKQGETWFAGGERSGISVQNPNANRRDNTPGGDVVSRLLRKAAANGAARVDREAPAAATSFTGSGYTLGSEDIASSHVPDPNLPSENNRVEVDRRIGLWRNGFTIEGGPLHSYDDPQNEELLNRMLSGNTPIEILNLQPYQDVRLLMEDNRGRDYVAPPTSTRAFGGSGNRLGSPMPGSEVATPSPAAPQASSSSSSGDSGDRPSVQTKLEVDRTQPVAQLRLRLPNNPRYPVTLNLTHTVGDLRNLINATGLSDPTRTYNLFPADEPSRVLSDDSVTIGDAKLDKRVVVLQLT